MALQRYTMQLRRNQYNERLDPFSRTLDLDDPEQLGIDGLLTKLFVDAVKRAGGKIDNLHEYDLQIKRHGSRDIEMVFVAHSSEVDEKDR
ncbi:hypothetical protein [Dactylosporangium salmoneum]|uniref:Uncharacterized protein n=1 Tax=Dactylosporangium salmoneum TaxID=53361 RepID=A0ABN3GA62_9ACTN